MKPATLHKGKTWWVIPDCSVGFSQMRNGFRDREQAEAWAADNGYQIHTVSAD